MLIKQKENLYDKNPPILSTVKLGDKERFEKEQIDVNKQNMTNPTILSQVKMEYGQNFSISGLKMMVKSGIEKIFLKFLHALTMSFLLLYLYF